MDKVTTPIGEMDVIAQPHRVVSVDFCDCRDRMLRLLEKRLGRVQLKPKKHEFGDRLRAYFDGEIAVMLPTEMTWQGTPFQQKVWQMVHQIPYGVTATYGEIAQGITHPKAAQAVGRANSLNPILIFIPCHRVIGKRDSMIGYSAGIDRKTWLLKYERSRITS